MGNLLIVDYKVNRAMERKRPKLSGAQFRKKRKEDEEKRAKDKDLRYVGGILAVVITFLSAALLIFYKKKKATKPKGPPMETEYADITDARRVYEEVREGDRPSSSPPVEVSTLYTAVKCSQTDGVKSSDEYSLATSSQNKAEDNLNELNYSVVDFSHKAEINSAPCSNVDNTVYSTPLVVTNSASNTKDASLPLYSTVEKQQ